MFLQRPRSFKNLICDKVVIKQVYVSVISRRQVYLCIKSTHASNLWVLTHHSVDLILPLPEVKFLDCYCPPLKLWEGSFSAVSIHPSVILFPEGTVPHVTIIHDAFGPTAQSSAPLPVQGPGNLETCSNLFN